MINDIISKLELLEIKIQNLISENFEYQQKNANFEKLLNEMSARLRGFEKENEALKLEIEQLKVGKAFAGKEGNNEEAKQKIDNLIREINHCITALKE